MMFVVDDQSGSSFLPRDRMKKNLVNKLFSMVRTENMPGYNLFECHIYFLIIFLIAYLQLFKI